MYDVLEKADALAIMTEWLDYRNPDFDRMREMMRGPLIVDSRNLYDPERMSELGFSYRCIGRSEVQ
jgi:UDPglucose 6-dehydrogenase